TSAEVMTNSEAPVELHPSVRRLCEMGFDRELVEDVLRQANPVRQRSALKRIDQDQRRKEFAREDLAAEISRDSLARTILESEQRVDTLRHLRRTKEQEAELRSHDAFLEAKRKREVEEETRLKEEAAAKQAEDEYQQALREWKIRQSIKESSEELRELEKKLDSAYLNKERSLQIQRKLLTLEQAKAEELQMKATMEKQLKLLKEEERRKAKEEQQRTIEYKGSLDQQLEEAEAKKKAEYHQFLREKALIDEIVQRIMAEDERESKRRMERQKEEKKYIESFLEARQKWRSAEKARQEAENQLIEEYARLQREREDQLRQAKKSVDHEKNLVYQKHIFFQLAAEMERKEKEQQELERLRIDYSQEEAEEKARKLDEELLKTRIRKRLELIEAFHKQMADKRRKLQIEQEEEGEFRRKLMEKFAEDEKIEQMTAQKRRMKQQEHKRAIDAIVEERRKRIQEQQAMELEAQRRERELEEYRQQVIEQERQRLLREHAVGLLGYLPKGIFKDEQDLDLFDETFRRQFQRSLDLAM
ncbi:hypothetical protein HK102_005998, partial [Quaeritorhiza haematococci]